MKQRIPTTLTACILVWALCCSALFVNAQTTRYVTATGAGSTDGSNWANAANDLQLVINNSSANDTIFVAGGTYKPTRPANNLNTIDSFNRDNAFVLKADVKIYGGFAGTETTLAERDLSIVANKSILSGDIGILGDSTDNCYHVVLAIGSAIDNTTVLDGFTITKANANGVSYIIVNSNILFQDIGGGMINFSSSPTITNCMFSGNSGLGMYNESNSSPIVTNCTFSGNGGGMYNTSSSPAITNCTFSGNSVNYGGAMYNTSSSPIITNCTFSGNSADDGGAMYNTSSSPIITNCTFSGNSADDGGGIFNYASSPIITNCTFSGNSATSYGGGLYNTISSSPTITNCIIYGNTIYNSGNILNIDGSHSIVTYSLVQGGSPGVGNINASIFSPLFINAPSYTTAPFTGGDYRLQPSSPAINAGTPDTTGLNIGNTDIAGNNRVKGIIDMGALEFQNLYYSTGNNAANVLANWNSERDGTGTAATSFTDTTRFTVQTGHTLTNNSNLSFGSSVLLSIENNAGIDNTGTLSVGGRFNNNGTITGAGVVELNGTMPPIQQINGTGTVSNLALKNSWGAIINGKVFITNTYIPISGTLITNNNLVLKSSATGTASIAQGNAGGTYIAGNIEVERFIPAKTARKWIFVSSPVTQSIANSWQQQIYITGAGIGGTVCPSLTPHSNGFDATITNTPNIYSYDAFQAEGNRWTALANTSTNIGVGVGFRVNVRGDRSLGCSLLDGNPSGLVPSAVTLRATGAVSNAAQNKNAGNFDIIYSNSGINNYILVGNPYPSAISFSALQTANNTVINNKYAIYIPENNAGIYTYWDGVSGKFFGGAADPAFDNSKGNIIANGQAFFVQSAFPGNVRLNFTETQKATETNVGYFRNARVFNEQIKVSYLQNNTKVDEAVIRYANDANISNTEESSLDINSMNSGTFISNVKATKNMVVQTRDLKTLTNDEVWLNIGATASGTYQLNFSEFENFAGTDIYLIDHYTNTTQNIRQNDTYEFSIDKDNAATKGSARFSVVFNKKLQPELTLNTVIKMYPNPADKQVTLQLPQENNVSYNIKVTDVIGKVIMQQKSAGGTEQLNISRLSQGTYIVEIIDNKGKRVAEKLIKN